MSFQSHWLSQVERYPKLGSPVDPITEIRISQFRLMLLRSYNAGHKDGRLEGHKQGFSEGYQLAQCEKKPSAIPPQSVQSPDGGKFDIFGFFDSITGNQ